MGFPGAHNVRRRPQGLGVARDVTHVLSVLHSRCAANHPSYFGDAPLAAGGHTGAELAELFNVARSTVYRAVQRARGPTV
jgi:hypothetical protein